MYSPAFDHKSSNELLNRNMRNETRYSSHDNRYRSAFTLIEVLLVLAILVVVAGFVTFNVIGVADEANKKAAKVQIANLASFVNTYRLTVGSFPSTLDALYTQPSDLQDVSKWTQLSAKPIPPDPWGRAYEFKIDGSKFEIRSVGPDGQSNTPDDIVN
jgi:general secretion pathway protein G